jgi:hypothetical protein
MLVGNEWETAQELDPEGASEDSIHRLKPPSEARL